MEITIGAMCAASAEGLAGLMEHLASAARTAGNNEQESALLSLASAFASVSVRARAQGDDSEAVIPERTAPTLDDIPARDLRRAARFLDVAGEKFDTDGSPFTGLALRLAALHFLRIDQQRRAVAATAN